MQIFSEFGSWIPIRQLFNSRVCGQCSYRPDNAFDPRMPLKGRISRRRQMPSIYDVLALDVSLVALLCKTGKIRKHRGHKIAVLGVLRT